MHAHTDTRTHAEASTGTNTHTHLGRLNQIDLKGRLGFYWAVKNSNVVMAEFA